MSSLSDFNARKSVRAPRMTLPSIMQSKKLAIGLILLASTVSAQVRPVERVRANDNRARAGIFSSGVLAVRMEARMAEWHPQGEDAPGAMVPAFAEIGRPAQIPGPLIRVAGGTDVIVVIRNAVPNTILTVHGLHSRPAYGAAFNDSIQLGYGQVQQLRFRLDRPGTYYYWGTTTGQAFNTRTREDAQLTGVIVVDEPGERAPRDRIIVLGMWADTTRSETVRHRLRELFVMNGRSWPHTDRIIYEKGEAVRWRVINASADPHPMHLHGFYYRVTRRGDGRADTLQSRADLVHTEAMPPGGTMSISFTPDRLGNWLFHCAEPSHSTARGPLGYPAQPALPNMHGTNATTAMGGLVTAVEVRLAEDDTSKTSPLPEAARRIRMILQPNAGGTPTTPFFGVTIDTAGLNPEIDRGQRIGPPLIVNRGQPTSILVINRTGEPTGIHWHGIELESYHDGVPGFSGIRPILTPHIPPSDSFEVKMTPPRAGTFIYRSHLEETRQQRAGLVGALIVTEPGKWDPTRDIPVVVSSPSDSVAEESAVLINGATAPLALDLRRGITYRLRLINITTARPGLRLELKQDTTVTTWRPVAKDGIDLAATTRGARPARQSLSIGETMDVEVLLVRPGEYRLEAHTRSGTLLGTLPIRVN
jgi:FtsP/CotA-like multicopper oxidase with cupredoxin domain